MGSGLDAPKDTCYICGRTPAQFESFFMTKEIASRIAALKESAKEPDAVYRKWIKELLAELRGNKFLDFQIGTIMTDYPKFQKLIPRLNDILSFRASKDQTIENVYSRLENLVEHESDISLTIVFNEMIRRDRYDTSNIGLEPELVNRLAADVAAASYVNNEIETLSKLMKPVRFRHINISVDSFNPEVLHDMQYHGFKEERDPKLIDAVMSNTFVVSLCPFCSTLFENASKAAYETSLE